MLPREIACPVLLLRLPVSFTFLFVFFVLSAAAEAFSHATTDNLLSSTSSATTSATTSTATTATTALETASQEAGIWIEKHLANVTKESGENVVMKCEFRGEPPLSISWSRNEAPLEHVKGKFDIRHSQYAGGKISSRLKIHQVDVHDMGFYKCTASNNMETAETTGVLRVEGGSYMSSQSIPDFNPIIPEFPGLYPESYRY